MEKLQNKKSIEHKILLILSHIKIINLVLTFFYIFCCAYVLRYTVSFTIYNAKDLLQIIYLRNYTLLFQENASI